MADQDPLKKLHPIHNQLLQNALTSNEPGRVVPPMPIPFNLPHPYTPFTTAAAAGAGATAPPINSATPRNYRRVPVQAQQQYIPPTGTYNGYPGYANRPFVPINTFNPYNTFGHPLTQLSQFQNPVIISAVENSHIAFDQIHSVVQSFSAISMMLESSYTAMNLAFQALLGVAENFSRLKVFITKLYSTIVSIKLARWFLIKIMHLSKMVMGNKRLNDEENLWENLSTLSRNGDPSAKRTWPFVVFAGLLASAPFFVYKLLTSGTSSSISEVSAPNNKLIFKALTDWSDHSLKNTISVVKGQSFCTNNKHVLSSSRNGGWLFVEDTNGQKGYVPSTIFFKSIKKANQSVPVNHNNGIHEQELPLVNSDELENH